MTTLTTRSKAEITPLHKRDDIKNILDEFQNNEFKNYSKPFREKLSILFEKILSLPIVSPITSPMKKPNYREDTENFDEKEETEQNESTAHNNTRKAVSKSSQVIQAVASNTVPPTVETSPSNPDL